MKIDCISDLHGYKPELEGGDLLIIAGDLTARDTPEQLQEFIEWVDIQDYKKIIIIAGNHDNILVDHPLFFEDYVDDIEYLCDSGTEFEGLKIWGSPWTAKFYRQNPECMAFALDADDLKEKWALIPEDTDILVTHSPPRNVLDHAYHKRTGCPDLRSVINKIEPKLHVFGHIHECGGQIRDFTGMQCVNASVVDQNYNHINKPVRIVL